MYNLYIYILVSNISSCFLLCFLIAVVSGYTLFVGMYFCSMRSWNGSRFRR